jgi:glycine/D-amino acid oxidase-like deaminating enzyme
MFARRTTVARRVVVVGGGIVGAALAAELVAHDGLDVTLVEAGPRGRLRGSTGHAPGFVGLLNEVPVATELAVRSADRYARLSRDGVRGFDRVGGLEVATTSAGLAALEHRAGLAAAAGLPVRVLGARATVAAAPDLVDPAQCAGGVLHARDGTARAPLAAEALLDLAAGGGARLVHDAEVTAVDVRAGRVRGVRVGGTDLPADDVVLACGIWGRPVAALAGVDLPVTPVAHPYVHGPRTGPRAASPFVRWPEHHVYARDHGDRLGLGTYDHVPVPVAPEQLTGGAERPWPADPFDDAVARALALLAPHHRFVPEQRLNGVFAMTPDNLPLLGPAPDVAGLWVAEALWVTHAAGAAAALVRAVVGARPDLDGLDALRPDRFAGVPAAELTERALHLYRDIYATDPV